jgi:hypothetical protein
MDKRQRAEGKANDEVYDFGKAAGFEEDAKDGSGARFLSVDVDLEVENDSNEVGEAHLIVARLAQKAVLAAEARKPILKKREIKPRFGGARGVLADNEAGRGQGGLDTIEAEFLRELEDNVPQTFLPPQNADDDENEVEDDLSKPFFFTQDVWEDIEYNQRKQSIIEQLSTASDRVAQAQVMLPQLKVENERLKNTARQLEQEVQKLADQERKIFQKYPDLKKKYQKNIKNDDDIIDQKETSDAQQESVNADEAKEQKRHLEKLRRRMLKRKNLVVKGLQNLEENERDKGESFAQDKNTYSVLNLLYTRAVQLKISIEKTFSAFDPYRPSLETIKKKMPRAVVYFQMLRRTNYVNSIFIIASVPQVIQWILGDALCSEDTLIMPCIFRFSSIQRYLGGDTGEGAGRLGVDMSLLYVYVNASAYLLVYFVTMRHYFTDFYVAIRAGIFQEDQNQYKISQIVLNSWNCSVFTRAAHGAIAERVCSQLALMFAIRKEEGIPTEEELDNGEVIPSRPPFRPSQ